MRLNINKPNCPMVKMKILTYLLLFLYFKVFILSSIPSDTRTLAEKSPYLQFEFNTYFPDGRILLVPEDKRKIFNYFNLKICASENQGLLCHGYLVISKREVLNNESLDEKYLLEKQLRI